MTQAITGVAGRVGRLPSMVVVGASYAGVVLASLVLPGSATTLVVIAMPLVVAVHCALRPRRGWEVLLIALAPGAASALAYATVGASRAAVGGVVAVAALAALRAIDGDHDDDHCSLPPTSEGA